MMKHTLLAMLTVLSINAAEVKEDIQVPYIPYEVKMGEHFDVVLAQCLTCHSFGYVINQGPQSKEYWKKKVDKMIVHFKAPMTQEDAVLVTEYLFEHYGNGQEK